MILLLWAFDQLLSGLSLSYCLMKLLNAEFYITSYLQALMLQEAKQDWHPFIRVKESAKKVNRNWKPPQHTQVGGQPSSSRQARDGAGWGTRGPAHQQSLPCPEHWKTEMTWGRAELKITAPFLCGYHAHTWSLTQYFVRITWSNG